MEIPILKIRVGETVHPRELNLKIRIAEAALGKQSRTRIKIVINKRIRSRIKIRSWTANATWQIESCS
jgi:hypothetical protein